MKNANVKRRFISSPSKLGLPVSASERAGTKTMNSSPAYSNGYHPQQQQHGMSQRDKVRRGTRARSRELRESFGSGGNFGGLRVSEHNKQQQQQQQQQGVPCTDFDMAYFHSYAHVGIHEEMIKVHFEYFFFSESITKFPSVSLGFQFFLTSSMLWVSSGVHGSWGNEI